MVQTIAGTFMILTMVIWIYYGINLHKDTDKKIKVQRERNNQAIKDWLEAKKQTVGQGYPMYHEKDVRFLIKLLDPKLDI